ncbi:MAG: S8 family serine peptidase [Lachnospiraceae bacterium]|nr:S8 family serine peptidase [Lachnospiraceae bacterium]
MKMGKRMQRLTALALSLSLAFMMTGSASAGKKLAEAEGIKAVTPADGKRQKAGGQGTGNLQEAGSGSGSLQWEEIKGEAGAGIEARQTPDASGSAMLDSEEVRVFVVLEGESALEGGFSARGISNDARAQSFADQTQARQELVLGDIQRAVGRHPLNVRYQFSLLSNAVSADVQYGDIERIQEVEGVKDVYIVPKYRLQEAAEPSTITAGEMVGSYEAWDGGYTGAGQRIAIIDTGIDLDHPSFDAGAFGYGRKMTQQKSGYKAEAGELLNVQEIAKVFGKLKASSKGAGKSPKNLYKNKKIAFAFNYAGDNLNVDSGSGDHGTHVAGIAAANQYVPAGDGKYRLQRDGVVGIAKDAQLLVMRVFDGSDEAFSDDYMAAVEDALLLGADVVNLSMGTPNPGESEAFSGEEFVNQVFQRLLDSDMVVSVAAGNYGSWAESSSVGHNRIQDVNMNMVGYPGSYANALTVASAVNAGYSDSGFMIGKRKYFYRDAEGNAAVPSMATLDSKGGGTDYEYEFLSSFGEAEDYADIDVRGKVVIISKGIIPYEEKHENAEKAGAAALIICNDDLGFPKLNLSGSKASIPCAMMGWEDSWSLEEKGTLCIFSEPLGNKKAAQGYRMSDFSAWGVPGDLALKPEITAPGENIYSSLYGGEYGCMSGTSMAAPSISGMSALVSEYIQRNGLEKKTGLSRRALTQALLMGTAVPLKEKDKEEYSPRKQGSGLANVRAATTTPAYILVGEKEGNDGKVKAELGDDPGRKGVYEFTFQVCNLTEKNQYYSLESSVLTEGVEDGEWIAESSHKLQPQVTYSSDSQVLMYDLNKDGTVDEADALELLRHVNESVCLERVERNKGKFDFHEDGVINTADVYGFLQELKVPTRDLQEQTLEVEQTAKVSVKVELSQADRKYLDGNFAHGMYVDGFVYLRGAVQLSVPMLAFYGSWTESSMFEPFDYLEFANGGAGGVVYSGGEIANYLNYYMAEADREFCYGSNMYLEGGDRKYLPDRNAFSTSSGDKIASISYTLIRNAALVRTTVTNDRTGEIYFQSEDRECEGAYFDSQKGEWRNKENYVYLDWQGRSKKGKPLPEGTRVRFTVTALPEYYKDKPEAAAEGARFSIPFTIDNTKPRLISMEDQSPGKIILTFADNRYTAAVKIYGRDKETLLAAYGVNQEKSGVPMNLAIRDPQQVFYVKLVDYAGNTALYRVNRSANPDTPYADGVALDQTDMTLIKNNSKRLKAIVSPESVLDNTVSWSSMDERIATVDSKGNVTGVAPGTTAIVAATKAKNMAGESETAVCQVTVGEIAVSLNGFMSDKEGDAWLCGIRTAGLPDYAKLRRIKKGRTYLAATAVEDKVFATVGDEEGADLYLIDPADNYRSSSKGSLDFAPSDLAFSPNTGFVFGVEGSLLHSFDCEDIYDVESTIDVGDATSGDGLAGIAYAGSSKEKDYGLVDWFWLVSQGGKLYELGYSVDLDDYVYGNILEEIGDTGIGMGNAQAFDSLYYEPASGYLFWSAYDGGQAAKLYALDCHRSEADVKPTVYYLGSFPEWEWPFVLINGESGKDGYSFEAGR